MASFLRPLSALAHLQIVMAFSAVAYVEAACLLLVGRGAPLGWLCAAFFGTLGVYLLDGVRSADREDAISQPRRAALSRRHRGGLSCLGVLALIGSCVLILREEPTLPVLFLLGTVGLLGLAHVLPLLPAGSKFTTTKDLILFKPLVVSTAWLLGALVVAGETGSLELAAATGFGLVTLPLLLLDSIWLDRRDMHADVRFGGPTLAARLAPIAFRGWCLFLLLLTLLGSWWPTGGGATLWWFWGGAG